MISGKYMGMRGWDLEPRWDIGERPGGGPESLPMYLALSAPVRRGFTPNWRTAGGWWHCSNKAFGSEKPSPKSLW